MVQREALQYELMFHFPTVNREIVQIQKLKVEPLWECDDSHYVGLYKIIVQLQFGDFLTDHTKSEAIAIEELDLQEEAGYFEYAFPFEGIGDVAGITVNDSSWKVEKEKLVVSWNSTVHIQQSVHVDESSVLQTVDTTPAPTLKPKPTPVTAQQQTPKPTPVTAQQQAPEPTPVTAQQQAPKPTPVTVQQQAPKPTPVTAQQQAPKPTPVTAQQQVPEPTPTLVSVQQQVLKPTPTPVSVQQQVPKPTPAAQAPVQEPKSTSTEEATKQSNIFLNDLVEQFSVWRSSDFRPQKQRNNDKE